MIKRWPIIRHLRWLLLSIEFQMWWRDAGRFYGSVPNQADIEYLDKVWRGDA